MKKIRHIIEKKVPETFDELFHLCDELQSSQITYVLGDISLEIKGNLVLKFTPRGNIWYEYKINSTTHTDLIFADRTPAQMWDLIYCIVESKDKRIKDLEDKKIELFRQGSNDWAYGLWTRAEDKFVEACKIVEKIKKLRGE